MGFLRKPVKYMGSVAN